MAAFDLLGRRWTLRILWELREGPLGFRELRTRCDEMSSSVLRTRLVQLLDARLVEQEESYALTDLGRELGSAIRPLLRWAERWQAAVDNTA
jgi:DNA-binding HxlR family transcriptional regulator